ncbi:hypothetical protein OPV22_007110 [Ensete ventricosum]|uniref:Secreted protein n=1 Tax=Ensete ventricosum TaxID=4639 RepID=A0AAV8RTN0_ENSVE|nr:hypothetical protein OPV22_007110 [Ensete ventricosum]
MALRCALRPLVGMASEWETNRWLLPSSCCLSLFALQVASIQYCTIMKGYVAYQAFGLVCLAKESTLWQIQVLQRGAPNPESSKQIDTNKNTLGEGHAVSLLCSPPKAK